MLPIAKYLCSRQCVDDVVGLRITQITRKVVNNTMLNYNTRLYFFPLNAGGPNLFVCELVMF